MNLYRRIEKIEEKGVISALHYLGFVHANDDESLIEAVTRLAEESGLTLDDVGYASVLWRDGHKLHGHETYQHPTVRTWDDVTRLVGFKSHDEWVDEFEREKSTTKNEVNRVS